MGSDSEIFGCYRCASLWVRPFDIFYNDRIDNPFLGIASVFLIFCSFFFSDSINFFQSPLMFHSSRNQIVAVWMVSRYVAPDGGVWDLGRLWNESPFSQYWTDYPNILVIFSDSINFVQIPLMFADSRDKIAAVWMVTRCVATGGEKEGMKAPFPNIGWVILIF